VDDGVRVRREVVSAEGPSELAAHMCTVSRGMYIMSPATARRIVRDATECSGSSDGTNHTARCTLSG